MKLDAKGKTLFRKRVNALVKSELYRNNFHRLLNEIDERDEVIHKLSNICEELIGCCNLHNVDVNDIKNEVKLLQSNLILNKDES
jgi:cell division GTPase FtsZ